MKTKRKNAKKRLHKGKKMEAKKALFMGLQPGSLTGTAPPPQDYMKFSLEQTFVPSVKP
jgi:hypothetical protein